MAVDADLRRPRLHQLFGLDPGCEGLTTALLEGSIDGRLCPIQVKGMMVLTSGELPPNPAEMFGSQRMQELLDKLMQEGDVVLIDCPPVLPVSEATVLAQGVDGVLLVVEVGHSRCKAAQHAVERLRQAQANLAEVVLSGVPTRKSSYHAYRKYDGNGSQQKGRPTTVQHLFGRGRKANAG